MMNILLKSVVALGFVGLAYGAAPDIESKLYPVLHTDSVTVTKRTDTTICWISHTTALRDAEPVIVAWKAWDAASSPTALESFSVTPYDPETLKAKPSQRFYAKGSANLNSQCVDLPTPLAGRNRSIVFSSKGEYNVWHHLWKVSRFTPEIRVNPISTLSDFATNEPPKTIMLPPSSTPSKLQYRVHGIDLYEVRTPSVSVAK